jgi:hypothetical protein
MKKIAVAVVMGLSLCTAGCTGMFPVAGDAALDAVVAFAEGQQQSGKLQLAKAGTAEKVNIHAQVEVRDK